MDIKIVGAIVLAIGILGLIYGGFSYTKEKHNVDIGPIDFKVEEKEHVNIPAWVGTAAVIIGAVMIAVGGRPRSSSP